VKKKFFKGLIVLLLLAIALLYITDYDYILKAVRTIYLKGHTTAYLEDYKEFDNRTLTTGAPSPWAIHKDYNSVEETERLVVLLPTS